MTQTMWTKEQQKEYCKNHYQKHKEQYKKRAKEWAKNHPESRRKIANKCSRKRYKRPEVKQQMIDYNRTWEKNHRERYLELKRIGQKKYLKKHLEQVKRKNSNWQKTHPEKIAEYNHKRRKLGFCPLNEKFEGSHGHHIDFECVIYIPKELHNSIFHCVETGKGMREINDKVFEWLENRA